MHQEETAQFQVRKARGEILESRVTRALLDPQADLGITVILVLQGEKADQERRVHLQMQKEKLDSQVFLVILDKWDHQAQRGFKELVVLQVYLEFMVPLAQLDLKVQKEVEDPEDQGVHRVTRGSRDHRDQRDSKGLWDKMEETGMDLRGSKDTRETMDTLASLVCRVSMVPKDPVEVKDIKVIEENRETRDVRVLKVLQETMGWMDTGVKKVLLESIQCLNVTWSNTYAKTVLAAPVMVPSVQFTPQTWR